MEREKFDDEDEFPEESEEIVDDDADVEEDIEEVDEDEEDLIEDDYDSDEDEDYDENDEEDRRHLYRRKKGFSWEEVEELDFSKPLRRNIDVEEEE